MDDLFYLWQNYMNLCVILVCWDAFTGMAQGRKMLLNAVQEGGWNETD